MQLVAAYKAHCMEQGFALDPHQVDAAEALQRFADASPSGAPARGAYLWGEVGRGKTMLMDLLYREFPTDRKRRVHFHALMREIRERLAAESGPNPMQRVAAQIAPPGSLICIDELHVSDVDNALVLEVLLTELLRNRLVIVTTSNFSPSCLLSDEAGIAHTSVESSGEPGPLYQASRAATRRMLDSAFDIVRIGGDDDYRTTTSTSPGGSFMQAPDPGRLDDWFRRHASGEITTTDATVFGRHFPIVRRSARALWFDYAAVCEGRFSYRDYLEVLATTDTVLVQDVDIRTLDGAKRFGWLIEVVYDASLNLAISSTRPREGLFREVTLPAHLDLEFERISSRIAELTR